MAFSDANALLSGPKQPIAKFEKIGDVVTGTLVDAEVAPVTDPMGNVQYDKNNNPKQQVIYTLQTDERDPEIEDDDGQRRLFAKWAIQKAISTCLAEAGLAKAGLQEGGKLTITFSATQKASQRGYQDIKLYTAAYEPPPARSLPAAAAAHPASGAGSHPQEMIDLAFKMYQTNPNTTLEVMSAATNIPVADLQDILSIL
jgi:hypothetical protein